MEWWQALVLGLVQGLTEFLPVSSSGHLVLFRDWLGVTTEAELFTAWAVLVHVATLIAVCWMLRADLRGLLGRRRRDILWIIVGTIPAAVVGLTLRDAIAARFDDPASTGIMLLVTGALLLTVRPRTAGNGFVAAPLEVVGVDAPSRPEEEPTDVGWRAALVAGLMQAVALLPGASRSGFTLVGGMRAGLHREEAFRFAFLLALPAIGGSAVLELPVLFEHAGEVGTGSMVIGFVAALAAGLAALAVLRRVVIAGRLHWFAAWCLPVGAAVLWMERTSLWG